jgi:hypothetical protein
LQPSSLSLPSLLLLLLLLLLLRAVVVADATVPPRLFRALAPAASCGT